MAVASRLGARRNSRNISSFRGCLQRPLIARDKQPIVLTQRSCVTSEGIQMNRVMQAIFTATIALAFVGAVQANETALAQEPDKDKKPAAQRAPSATRAAPRAAPAAPRQVARPPVPRPAAQAPARAPASVQRARPQRPAAVQRAEPQRPAAVQRTPQQRQVQERQLQLRARQARPQQSAPKQVEKGPSPRTLPPSRALSPSRDRRQAISNVARFASVFSEIPGCNASPAASSMSRSLRVAASRGAIGCTASPRPCWRLSPRTPLTGISSSMTRSAWLIPTATPSLMSSLPRSSKPALNRRTGPRLPSPPIRCGVCMLLPRRIKPGLIGASVSLSGPDPTQR